MLFLKLLCIKIYLIALYLCLILIPLILLITKTENIEGLTVSEINLLIQQGGRFVMFPNIMSKLKSIYFVRPKEKIFKYTLKHFF